MPKPLLGRPVAKALSHDVRKTVETWKSRGVQPKLVTLLANDDHAASVYANQKKRIAERLGIQCDVMELPQQSETEAIVREILALNDDPSVHGIMIEMPLAPSVDVQRVVGAIHALKDVDGLSPCHSFAKPTPEAALYPATPLACIRLLKHYGYELKGADVTLVGCGQTVGMPLLHLLIAEGATVAACHEHTRDVRAHLRDSEIAIVAVGKGGLLGPDMVHEGLTVVDVGISQGENGDVQGDLAPEAAAKTKAYTPTPGGVGAVTTVQIFANLMHAMELQEAAGMV
ncbi:bifunctional 5,10-methylenetetrahydrofolate dehydrogenase/5,10-methenyltetrahydrofolate cyclohydrolase [Alicyclobacillus mali (ex Roth et al. 2021)]|uniref:bifunctional 5,10-methylenetetrahydrofolate dehydrogenase/5,10-methenyltetrahydrofolate cyclohydrolase n=1 Tax=Alicyclobacillus mali (ex Roth et al. 2021) TaxID=1123961 RepID=UPI000833C2FC|nr:bifunctional 5,10-methylenetetrahydrofolate dehydrogenase/5,10-methenyltetrahydrofolate cyclohydrolase [Alicyclobacillus mali (ex Roth et al. 2021)]